MSAIESKPLLVKHCPTEMYPAWIPCVEAMPDNARCVLVSDSENVYVALRFKGGECEDAYSESGYDSVITHWMELPLVPDDH